MQLDDATRQQIEGLIQQNPVMLFMKGDRQQPQCGFSAQVVEILDQLVPSYATADVLADPALRNGIKIFSNWPTIPQLYVRGELVGGCDIVKELFASGELFQLLGVARPEEKPPAIAISERAAAELSKLSAERPGQALHLGIDARFQNSLWFGPEQPGDQRLDIAGVTLFLDRLTSARADGVKIDLVDTDRGAGFHVENPNAPSAVGQLTAHELKQRLDAGEKLAFFDVRTPEERAQAHIEGARLVDAEVAREIEKLDRDTPLVFHCHHGGRSQRAAEHFAALGFRRVYNLVGGIDAWSREVDPDVPRY
jgi:monothiol glutaredoxin